MNSCQAFISYFAGSGKRRRKLPDWTSWPTNATVRFYRNTRILTIAKVCTEKVIALRRVGSIDKKGKEHEISIILALSTAFTYG